MGPLRITEIVAGSQFRLLRGGVVRRRTGSPAWDLSVPAAPMGSGPKCLDIQRISIL